MFHLYIAIKTLDIQGSLSVSAKDLAALKDAISDVDLALETNLFEMNNDPTCDESNDEAVSDEFEISDDEEEEEEKKVKMKKMKATEMLLLNIRNHQSLQSLLV